jgi:hypothetical protein
LVLQRNGHFGSSTRALSKYTLETGQKTYAWPSRMKDLRPLPRPVELALPPRATVIADSTALLPPANSRPSVVCPAKFDQAAYFRCALDSCEHIGQVMDVD